MMEDLIFLAILAGLFFLPAIAASSRNHPKFGGILLLNIVIGWTGIGWILLLAYAVLSDVPPNADAP